MPVPFEHRQTLAQPLLTVLQRICAGLEALGAVDPAALADLSPTAAERHLANLVGVAWSVEAHELAALSRLTPAELEARLAGIVAGRTSAAAT